MFFVRDSSLNSIVNMLSALALPTLERKFKRRESDVEVHTNTPFFIRLDGVGFGRMLEGFRRPRDVRVHNALIDAAVVLMKRYSLPLAYIISDEVNVLVYDSNIYSGRVEKIVSITAAIMSSHTSLALERPLYFDSRIIPVNKNEIKEYILYRARVGFNNYINSLLKELNIDEKVLSEMHLKDRVKLLYKLDQDLGQREIWEYLGTSIFWIEVKKQAHNKLTGEKVTVKRRIISIKQGVMDLIQYVDSLLKQ